MKVFLKMSVAIGIALYIISGGVSHSQQIVFTEYPAETLKVLELDKKNKTVVLESPDGYETASLTIGDVVGEQRGVIKNIQPHAIFLRVEPSYEEDTDKPKTVIIQVIKFQAATPSE